MSQFGLPDSNDDKNESMWNHTQLDSTLIYLLHTGNKVHA